MQTLQVDILNPQAAGLLQQMAEMDLIAIRDEPDKPGKLRRKFGCGKGEMTILPSFDDPLEEFEEYE